jgi:hypothetical protein
MNRDDHWVETLAQVAVRDGDNRELVLGSLWHEQPAALVFIRHFGCLLARHQVAGLAARQQEFTRLGIELVVIGNGNAADIPEFRSASRFSGPILTDPSRASYRLAAFRDGLFTCLGPQTLAEGLRAILAGRRQGSLQGAPFQQGGVLVIVPGNRLVYHYRSREAGDHPLVSDILAACRSALAAPAHPG